MVSGVTAKDANPLSTGGTPSHNNYSHLGSGQRPTCCSHRATSTLACIGRRWGVRAIVPDEDSTAATIAAARQARDIGMVVSVVCRSCPVFVVRGLLRGFSLRTRLRLIHKSNESCGQSCSQLIKFVSRPSWPPAQGLKRSHRSVLARFELVL
jgi:hypothetical protein